MPVESDGEMRVHVDTDRCVFTMQCTFHAPDVFDIDDHGEMTYRSRISKNDLKMVERAAELCPSRAIGVTTTRDGDPDDESKEQNP